MARNIVLICLDSVRKDIFDQVAVRTQELADLSFDNCRAASSWSVPSHASMISGSLAHEHNVTTHSRSFSSLSIEDTIFEDLKEYRTLGVSGNVYAGPSYEFDEYFDRFFTLQRGIRFPDALNPYTESYNLSARGLLTYLRDCIKYSNTFESLVNGFSGFLDAVTSISPRIFDEGARPGLNLTRKELQNGTEPLFIFLNLMESHIPYQPARYLNTEFYDVPRDWSSDEKSVWELIEGEYDEQYWNRRNQLYRATVDYLDRCISDFVDSISEDTTIIVTADHGDNLGTEIDEGLANHKSSLSEGLLHVPLYIINSPEIDNQTGQYLSQLSLPQLIEGCRDGYIPDLTRDRAFAELAGMSAGPDPEVGYEYHDRAIRCAYYKDEKIVWDSLGNCTKYSIEQDGMNWQCHSCNLDQPPLWATERFGNEISNFKTDAVESRERVALDQSTAERLEELGYL